MRSHVPCSTDRPAASVTAAAVATVLTESE